MPCLQEHQAISGMIPCQNINSDKGHGIRVTETLCIILVVVVVIIVLIIPLVIQVLFVFRLMLNHSRQARNIGLVVKSP